MPILEPLLQTAALTSSGLFTGYTWALSHAAIPAVLHASDPLQSAQWRTQYLAGFYISRPLCVVNLLTFGYLSYTSPPGLASRSLYLLAALTSASGVPYALTFLRKTNGALSRRAHRVAGRHGDDPIALTYARRRGGVWSGRGLGARRRWLGGGGGIMILGLLYYCWARWRALWG